jgi:uncharacterized damage-inducible protein DinB
MMPDEANIVFDFLMPQLESEQGITKKILSSVPPERGSYRPSPGSRSAFELARHIALAELWLLDGLIHQRFGESPPLPETIKTGPEIAQWYAENFACRVGLLKQLSGEALATEVDFHGLRKYPAVTFLNIAIRHSVHHRGQLSAYLRPMGAQVPAIYVESGDEPFSGSGEDAMALPPEKRPPVF